MAAEVDSSKEAVSKMLRVLDSTSASSRERVRALDTLAAIGKARLGSPPLADPVPLLNCLRWLLTSKNTYTRCAALRILRCYTHDVGLMRRAWEMKLDWFVARSMDRSSDRDAKLEKERVQAYRCVQRYAEVLMKEHKQAVEVTEGPPPPPAPLPPSQYSGGAAALNSYSVGSALKAGSFGVTGGQSGGNSRDASGQGSYLSNSPQSLGGHGSSHDSSSGGAGGGGGGATASAGGFLQMSAMEQPTHLLPGGKQGGGGGAADSAAKAAAAAAAAAARKYPPPPRGIVFRLANSASDGEDAFQKRAIVTLRDLLVCCPACVSDANALRAIVQVLTEPDLASLHNGLAWALLCAWDNPVSRSMFRTSLDLQAIFSPFTEKIGRDTADLKKRLTCVKDVLLIFLRSWSGLLLLANDPLGLKPLIDTLRLPGPAFRKMAIFELLHTAIRAAAPLRGIPPTGPWTEFNEDAVGRAGGGGGDARRPSRDDDAYHSDSHTGRGGDRAAGGGGGASSDDTDRKRRYTSTTACAERTLMDTFLGYLLLLLEKSSLLDTLISLVKMGMTDPSGGGGAAGPSHQSAAPAGAGGGGGGGGGQGGGGGGAGGGGGNAGDKKGSKDGVLDSGKVWEQHGVWVSQGAAHLLHTILILSSNMFPAASSYKLYGQFDRTIVQMLRSSFMDGRTELMSSASKVRAMTNSVVHKITYSVPPSKEVRLESIKLQMSSNLEDAQFRILLNDSQVTSTKDWNRWNSETALFLIKGPLRLHTRLQETMKTKFFKRLLTFLKPRRSLFSELPYKEENLVYSDLACGLIDLLLQSKEGAHYLSQSGLFEELLAILKEVSESLPEREKVLCKERIMYFMAREYFRLIGKCSETLLGVDLLVKKGILAELQSMMAALSRTRDDICHQILKHLHFGRVGNCPVNPEAQKIFENAMSQGSRPIRLCATLKLKRSVLAQKSRHSDMVDWTLDILEAQLSDSWREVAKAAHDIINEWCMADDYVLDSFIKKKPTMKMFFQRDGSEQPDDSAHSLLLRMLTREAGFQYLHHLGVVDTQLHAWQSSLSMGWVSNVETRLSAQLFSMAPSLGQTSNTSSAKLASASKMRRVPKSPGGPSWGDGLDAGGLALNPPHFFGEVAKTLPGCEFLRDSGVLEEYAATVKNGIVSQGTSSVWTPAGGAGGAGAHQHGGATGSPSRLAYDEDDFLSGTHGSGSLGRYRSCADDTLLLDMDEDAESEVCRSGDVAHTCEQHTHTHSQRHPWHADADFEPGYDCRYARPWRVNSSFCDDDDYHGGGPAWGHHTDAEECDYAPRMCLLHESHTHTHTVIFYTPFSATSPLTGSQRTKGMSVRNSLAFRAALWVIAQVGSSDTGFAILESIPACSDLIHIMAKLATRVDSLSLKGALACMLSMLGQSRSGRDALRKYGWVTHESEGYASTPGAWIGVCLAYPSAYDDWSAVHTEPYAASPSTNVFGDDLSARKQPAEELFKEHGVTTKNAPDFYPRLDEMAAEIVKKRGGGSAGITLQSVKQEFLVLLALHHQESGQHHASSNAAFDVVLTHVRSMSNPVMVDTARKTLVGVRQHDISIFHDPHLSLEMHELLCTYRFRAATRRYLNDTYIDQAVYTHEAFAYLDARFAHSQPVPSTTVCETNVVDKGREGGNTYSHTHTHTHTHTEPQPRRLLERTLLPCPEADVAKPFQNGTGRDGHHTSLGRSFQ